VPCAAEPQPARVEIATSGGYGWQNHVGNGPSVGVLYAHRIASDPIWLTIRPSATIDPDQGGLKGSTWALGLGLRYTFGDLGRVHLAAGLEFVPRYYNEPGLGIDLQLPVSIYVPVVSPVAFVATAAPAIGFSRLGDERSHTDVQRRFEATAGIAARF